MGSSTTFTLSFDSQSHTSTNAAQKVAMLSAIFDLNHENNVLL